MRIMTFEIALALLDRVRIISEYVVFFLAGVISLLGFVSLMVVSTSQTKTVSDYWKEWKGNRLIIALVICGLFNLIPSVDDLWKVRIGLIKLTLASPENISKSSDEIIRIGKKLECKYLGCNEEKK